MVLKHDVVVVAVVDNIVVVGLHSAVVVVDKSVEAAYYNEAAEQVEAA